MWPTNVRDEDEVNTSTRSVLISSSNCVLHVTRTSSHSLQDIPFLIPNPSMNRSSVAQVTQQWPPPFLLNQTASFPLSIAVQSSETSSQPKRHPLRRESTLPGFNHERRESSLWPFRTINAVFHKQTSEIKENDLFFSAWISSLVFSRFISFLVLVEAFATHQSENKSSDRWDTWIYTRVQSQRVTSSLWHTSKIEACDLS
jgi:hypothetical protein